MHLGIDIEGIGGVPVALAAHVAAVVVDAEDAPAQVVAAIHIVAHPGEAWLEAVLVDYILRRDRPVFGLYLPPYEGLRGAQDVAVTRAGEAVENAALAQVDNGVARDGAEEAAAVHKLTLGHVFAAVGSLRHTGLRAAKVHIATIFRVILVLTAIESVLTICTVDVVVGGRDDLRLADDALLAAAEYLEGVAAVQVDDRRTPYLGVLTLAAAEDVEGRTKHVHTLLAQDDAGAPLRDVVVGLARLGGAVEAFLLAQFVTLYLIEEHVALHERGIEVDHHVAVDDTALAAAAVDVAAVETARKVVSRTAVG